MKRMLARRKWYARLLLAVFVPMLLLSLVHVHEQGVADETVCADCEHHVHHSHLASADFCVDSCVLCQILSLPFVTGILLSVILFPTMSKSLPSLAVVSTANGHADNRQSRAPPCL